MGVSELIARIRDTGTVDSDEFEARVAEEAAELKDELRLGTFDNHQSIVGLEYEFYAVDEQTNALKRVPRRLVEFVGFEEELGLHNAEMQTTPEPLSAHGIRAIEAEVQAKLEAAQNELSAHGMCLLSDGLWTVPPVGESASDYLTSSVVEDGVRLATNMSDSVRYHAMTNTEFGGDLELSAPHVSLESETVLPESLITSIQPHYQVPTAEDLPAHFRHALRVAAPLLALSVNSPFFPPDLYVGDPDEILAGCPMENRIDVFESVLNPRDAPKVRFPRDIESCEGAVDRIAADTTIVPMMQDSEGRYDDRFAHFRHTHGTYWRWVRPVFDGATRGAANARIELRPLAAQPTVRGSVALLAVFAGLMESMPRRDHPAGDLDWDRARRNFYAAAADGLQAELDWRTQDGRATSKIETIYEDLFAAARDGLRLRGFDDAACEYYISPLRERITERVTPARWKYDRVHDSVEAGVPFTEAVWEMQSAYVDRQRETLVTGCFTEWL